MLQYTVVIVVGNTAYSSVWGDIISDGGVFFLGERFRTQNFDNDIVEVLQDGFDDGWMIDWVFLCNNDVTGPGKQIAKSETVPHQSPLFTSVVAVRKTLKVNDR